MGKSWLTAVKRAFRSPTKDTHKKSKTRDDTAHQQDQDQDKRDRRRWAFRKQANQETVVSTQMKVKPSSTADQSVSVVAVATATDQRRAVAVAVATAQPARLNNSRGTGGRDRNRHHYAAIVIQTAFRGYLARRALRALRGLVKLQALVRGHNVRKQAKMTLRCMQALVRVQSRVLDRRTRFSHEGSSSRKSTFSDTNSVWESRYLHDISDRKSMSREGSSIASDWDERPHTVEEVKAMLQRRKEAAAAMAMRRDKSSSQQIRRNGGKSSMVNEDDLEERPKRMDGWMSTKPWENRGRASTDQRDPIKNVEMDTLQPYSYLGTSNYRRSHPNYQYNPPQLHQPQRHSIASPHHRTTQNAPTQRSPATPSPSKSRPIQVRSASPRYSREDRSYHTPQTPNLRLNNSNSNHNNYRGNNISLSSRGGTSNGGAGMPNYMAATESAKARSRSQSAPRQRASTPERERDRVGSARKRLSYPAAHDPYNVGMANSLRSPSFKSVCGSHFGLEQHSNYSSCCTDSFAGEISPSSTSDLRRWLR